MLAGGDTLWAYQTITDHDSAKTDDDMTATDDETSAMWNSWFGECTAAACHVCALVGQVACFVQMCCWTDQITTVGESSYEFSHDWQCLHTVQTPPH